MPLSDDELAKLFVESVAGEPSDEEIEEVGKMIQRLSGTDDVRRRISGEPAPMGEPRPMREAASGLRLVNRKKKPKK